MEEKLVFNFDHEGENRKDLLGGKGANLVEMTRIGLPVPYGFTITTEACRAYYNNGGSLPEKIETQVNASVERLEEKTGKRLGDPSNPLLVSVRSGAVQSMPGMMDTVLNLGMNDETVEGLAALTGNRRFAYDSYRRFIQMFGDVVLGIDIGLFEKELERTRAENGYASDTECTADDWAQVTEVFKEIVSRHSSEGFPQDPKEQLVLAIRAVFDSWNNKRAVTYRKYHDIPDHLGTAVNVQSMVFGNTGERSGTGVAFTRNPSTGESELYGEYLVNAQGEDVVAGIRTPQPIATLESEMPDVYRQLADTMINLEQHYKDMQDIEFTIEHGNLFILQTRSGKRTAEAAVRIAVEMVQEGIMDEREALLRVQPEQITQLLHHRIDPEDKSVPVATGLPASPGAASGQVVFDADEAERLAEEGRQVILVRPETTPEDIHGIVSARATVTTRGGMTSHAAVVARGMGKACICGCSEITIDAEAGFLTANGTKIEEGETITVDGSSGEIFTGTLSTVDPELSAPFRSLLGWTERETDMRVRANADTPEDAEKAFEFGAEGIGLCRTEHMFMDPERIPVVQEMILAENKENRERALEKLLPMQQDDFRKMFTTMRGKPVTIRLLDPPLHEFLPATEDLLVEVTKLEIEQPGSEKLEEKKNLLRHVRTLEESNPMLGHRGCRLGITYPEIYEMQMRAIFHAVREVKEAGTEVRPEIMIPLVSHVSEFRQMKELAARVAGEMEEEYGQRIDYLIGTMIETPRAALTAEAIAREADFFSFGTNDLTQMTFGFSRDDAEGKFLKQYVEGELLPENPFMSLDTDGVGKLVELGVTAGKESNAGLKTGICGEHGGDTASIRFCYERGLDYVSCSPYRVPSARLAAAQETVRSGRRPRARELQPQ